ncbi:MAG: cytochrome b/b6 domain-containing protein [Burkholderiaceae bacterium]
MNETSTSPAEAASVEQVQRKVLVWDAPVRVFHWMMVFSFAGAYLTAESERWRLLHVTLGYTMAGLVAFRIVWGLVGTRNARFANFVRGPRAVLRYLNAMLSKEPEHHTGHNPAGAVAIVAMLALTLAVSASGWAVFNDTGGQWLEELHEFAANTMLAVIGVHIAGVVFASWHERENLVGAMISGRKAGRPEDSVRSAWRSVAVLMLIAVAGFWWAQWQSAPASGSLAALPAAASHAESGERGERGEHDKD